MRWHESAGIKLKGRFAMTITHWLAGLYGSVQCAPPRRIRRRPPFRQFPWSAGVQLELLEDRTLLSSSPLAGLSDAGIVAPGEVEVQDLTASVLEAAGADAHVNRV